MRVLQWHGHLRRILILICGTKLMERESHMATQETPGIYFSIGIRPRDPKPLYCAAIVSLMLYYVPRFSLIPCHV